MSPFAKDPLGGRGKERHRSLDGPPRAASGGREIGGVLGRAESGIKQPLEKNLDAALRIGLYANCFSSLNLFSYLKMRKITLLRDFSVFEKRARRPCGAQ